MKKELVKIALLIKTTKPTKCPKKVLLAKQ